MQLGGIGVSQGLDKVFPKWELRRFGGWNDRVPELLAREPNLGCDTMKALQMELLG